ncbi:MAG TPA: 50S ribosomal protein L9 [Polyangia bacterium]|jgi:large subunit ribosomal protein L9|nr:50S ribosomal protein L9 [Polyangia bacterium]
MQVILRDDMDNLGKSGEVVNVKPGYARNFLLPRGHAIKATAGDIKRVEHEKRVIAARTAKMAKEAQAEADKLSQVSVSISRAVGEEDKLYGSVTSRDIAEALAGKGVKVDSKKIHLEEPIKTLGMTEVQVKLGRGVNATVKVWVVKEEK